MGVSAGAMTFAGGCLRCLKAVIQWHLFACARRDPIWSLFPHGGATGHQPKFSFSAAGPAYLAALAVYL
jgi:predicted Fe-S protein YdhL (DUF1289 family)